MQTVAIDPLEPYGLVYITTHKGICIQNPGTLPPPPTMLLNVLLLPYFQTAISMLTVIHTLVVDGCACAVVETACFVISVFLPAIDLVI